MSDKPSAPSADPDVAETAQWRIEGSVDYHPDGAPGLDDTVVRLPPITDSDPPPVTAGPAPAAAVAGAEPAPRPESPWAAPAAADPVATDPAPVAESPAPAAWHPVTNPAATTRTTTTLPATEVTGRAPAPVSPSIEPAGDGVPPAAVVPPRPHPAATGPRPSVRRTRKARLRLSRIDPWSVMKTSFLFSIAFGIMFWVATYMVWTVIGASGLFDAMNEAIRNILSSPNDTSPWRIEDYVNTNKVLGIAALIAVINVVIMTALGTLTAFLYNLSANILGGLELTLAED